MPEPQEGVWKIPRTFMFSEALLPSEPFVMINAAAKICPTKTLAGYDGAAAPPTPAYAGAAPWSITARNDAMRDATPANVQNLDLICPPRPNDARCVPGRTERSTRL